MEQADTSPFFGLFVCRPSFNDSSVRGGLCLMTHSPLPEHVRLYAHPARTFSHVIRRGARLDGDLVTKGAPFLRGGR